ncbi:OB-fold nucleic acid binding domain-containing protein [Massilia sp. H-1]|nr:OB-fold nucleic acid binding domain-containing protein [Massilia sp. H-1]
MCALLNSQPMGFYSPSALVQDAQRHGIEVRATDITVSGWDSALEPSAQAQPAWCAWACRCCAACGQRRRRGSRMRAIRPFESVSDLARRAQLDRHDLQVLVGANALAALAGHRRQALWQAVGAVPDKDLLRPTSPVEEIPQLAAPSEGENIVGDYRAQGLTLGRHPLALLRALLANRFLPSVHPQRLPGWPAGARGLSIVTVRQRPGTAKGVLFMTLEDETGNVNVIVWPSLVEQQRKEVLGAALLGVYGVWQRQGEVRHLVAKRLVDMSALLGRLDTTSRNFC